MGNISKQLNAKQLFFKEMFIGILIYAVVLEFFNDYTDIVSANSFSTVFLAAIVLQLLTYLVIQLKVQIFNKYKIKTEQKHKLQMVFIIWLIMFFSKFVFMYVIDFIFGDNLNIIGFFGALLLVLSVTIIGKLADYVFKILGD